MNENLPRIVALIPARSGSKRVPDKNIRLLDRHPVLAYTIAAAHQSGIFTDIIVSTDTEKLASIFPEKRMFLILVRAVGSSLTCYPEWDSMYMV